MDTTKLITGTLIGTIAGFIAGFLIYGMALSGYMADNISGGLEQPDMVWIVLGHLVHAFIITYIFIKWAGISTAASGAKAGALIVFFVNLGMDFLYMGSTTMITGGVATALVDSIAAAIVWAVGGAAIGWWLGRGAAKA